MQSRVWFRGIFSLSTFALSLLTAGVLTGCGGGAAPTASVPGDTANTNPATPAETPADATVTPASIERVRIPREEPNPEVVMKTSLGTVRIRLFRDKAPQSVENFLGNYVERNLYDGTIVHFANKGAMIMAGGYNAQMQPIQSRGEVRNESMNGLKNKRGTIAVARNPQSIHSGSNQFFFNLADAPALDHQDYDIPEKFGYCVFGEVIEGMDIIDQIGAVPVRDEASMPKVPVSTVLIESMRRVK